MNYSTMKQKNLGLPGKIITMVIISEVAGLVGSIFTFPSIGTWYLTLNRPAFTPPNWVFGPVWITLFALMGIAAGLVWNSKNKGKGFALKIFGIQLTLNVLWSILFFGLHTISFALAEIIILWMAIAATIYLFNKISRTAAILLLPYILWTAIAALLNYSIFVINV